MKRRQEAAEEADRQRLQAEAGKIERLLALFEISS